MEKVIGIEHMSNEMLSLVFHFLDWKSFVRANAVCKAWRHFHKEDYLWKHMYLRDFIEFKDNGPLPNLPFATLYQKSILYRNWKLIHTHKTFDEAWQVSFSPNGQYLASSDKAGALKIWQLNIQQEPTPSVAIEELFTRTYMESITRHEWSPNSNHLICTMSDDSAVGLNMKDWSDSLFVRVALFDCYAGWLNGDQMLHTLRYSNNGPGVKEMIMQLTDVATKKLIWKSFVHCGPTMIHFNILSPKKTYVAGATASIGSVDIDMLDELWLVEVEQLKKRAVPYKEANFDEDGIYDDEEDDETEKPKPEATTRDHCKIIRETGHIIGFTFSEDEEQLLINIRPFTDPSNTAVVNDIETHLWDVKTLTKISSWTVGQCKDMFIVHPSFALSEQIICSGSGDGKLTFVHKHSENVIHQFKAHEKLLNFATVHPEVDLLVTASDSNEVKFWIPLHSNLDAKFVQ